ncbi:MAG: hypothetical protein ACK4UQ_06665 [Brevundimonas sp.]
MDAKSLMKNAKQKGVAGAVVAGLIAICGIAFKENVVSLLEAAGLTKVWKLVHPAIEIVKVGLTLLIHPIMTHIYALLIGIVLGVLLVRLLFKATQDKSEPDIPIKLIDVVNHLREKSVWAAQQGHLRDRDIELLLLDALAHGQLQGYARHADQYGQTSPLQEIASSYFGAVRIDMEAIKARRDAQIVSKIGYHANEFEDWQFSKAQVESLWPPKAK